MMLLKKRTLLAMEYNPKNTKKPTSFSFHIEEIVNETSNGKVHLNTNLLKQDYKKRIEVEHSISTTKSLGLEYTQVRGYNTVNTHTFLILIYPLAIGIYKFIPTLTVKGIRCS